ncbi:hypothetical protein ACFX2C_028032 [Malus domestica]
MEQQPHVVIFPLPLQDHIKPLLCLAELLCHSGFHVTFVNTHQNYKRFGNSEAISTHFPTLHFESISDGLPEEHPRAISSTLLIELKSSIKPPFRELLKTIILRADDKDHVIGCWVPPLTCIITDGTLAGAFDIAQELGIPIIAHNVPYPGYLWTVLSIPKLVEQGQIPFKDDDMNVEIMGVPGMEGYLRRRDLPGFCKVKQADHPALQYISNEYKTLKRASALILDSVYELDAPILSHMAQVFPKIYTLGPIHALLNSQVGDISRELNSHTKTAQKCMTWLDNHPSRSVIYVSFGSLVKLTHEQVIEFWYGLVKSGQPFIWVIRSDITSRQDLDVPAELETGTKERGFIVEWAPQEEVLAHIAVGGFLTHSGWNSTLEGIVAGVPMICFPILGDHMIVSRTVCLKWKIGLPLSENCDRSEIETVIKDLMGYKKEGIQKSMDSTSKLARDSVKKGGSSHCNLELLIQQIRDMQTNCS